LAEPFPNLPKVYSLPQRRGSSLEPSPFSTSIPNPRVDHGGFCA
jgi:hypothetical protein